MDVNNINPVFEAFTCVLPQIGFQTVEKKEMTVAKAVLPNKGVMVNIGVVGTLKGTIVFDMDMDSAKKFASTMMMGMEVTEFDDLAQSAICEMSNMVCANACTNFSQNGIEGLNISPPVLLTGSNGFMKLSAPVVLVVRFLVDNSINVNLCVGLFNDTEAIS